MSLISVILSAYNEPIFMIKNSVDSILNQSYKKIELILINDNPDYKELNQLFESYQKSDTRVKYIRHQCNMGLVASLNEGIDRANGDYIARMDADDVSVSERLEAQMQYLLDNHFDMVGCWIKKINELGEEIGELKVPCNLDSIKKYQLYGNCVLHPTWLVKRDVYKTLNGYRYIYACEDYDFILRAIQNGFKIGNLPEFKLLYRIRSNSISNSANIKQKLTMYYLIDNGGIDTEVPLTEINNYLESDKYMKDYSILERYESDKYQIRNTHSIIDKIYLCIKIIFNYYFYRNIIEHKKLKERVSYV